MKKVLAVFVSLALVAGAVFANGQKQSAPAAAGGAKAATAASKPFLVGYSNDNDADFFRNYLKDTFRDLIKDDPNFKVTFTNSAADMQKQIDQINNFIAQGMQAIIVQPGDTTGIIPAIEACNKANIPVISICSKSGGGKSCYVGNAYIDGGILQGQFMAKALPKNAKIVYMQGQPGFDHSRLRRQGFLDTIHKERPDVTVLADKTANYDRAQGMALMEDWLQAFPQIDGVICANDQMALGAIQALKAANRLKGCHIAGVDCTDEMLQDIKAGIADVSILQSAPLEAKGAYEMLKKLRAGETLPAEDIIPQVAVTKDNVDQYLKK
jgi:inositol transport system substrate-binding protein